jgi:outer membrane lipoprotein-sorting protein
MRILCLTLLLLSAAFVGAKEIPTRFVSALQRALDADATWVMTKTLPDLKQPILSTGSVSCWKEKGMVWKTLTPFEEEIRITKESITLLIDDEVETQSCDEMPYYSDICEATDAFLEGDTEAFEDLFDWTWQSASETSAWTMTLEVKPRQMRRLFKTITLSGNETLEAVTFVSGDKKMGSTHLRFTETKDSHHALWTFEDTL